MDERMYKAKGSLKIQIQGYKMNFTTKKKSTKQKNNQQKKKRDKKKKQTLQK